MYLVKNVLHSQKSIPEELSRFIASECEIHDNIYHDDDPDVILNFLNVDDIQQYSEMFEVTKGIDEITEDIANRRDSQDIEFMARGVVEEQYAKIQQNMNVEAYYVGCTLMSRIHPNTEFLYGGVFLFIGSSGDYAYIESISKYVLPMVFQTTYPRIKTPKLNDILLSAIENILKDMGIHRLYVAPLRKQREILTKHYGFKSVERSEVPPRPYTSGGEFGWLTKEYVD